MIQKWCERFETQAAAKYTAGQAQHGGLLTDRDCLQEQVQEIIDLWHYHMGEKIRVEQLVFNTPEEIRKFSLQRFRDVAGPQCKLTPTWKESLICQLWSCIQIELEARAERAGRQLFAP